MDAYMRAQRQRFLAAYSVIVRKPREEVFCSDVDALLAPIVEDISTLLDTYAPLGTPFVAEVMMLIASGVRAGLPDKGVQMMDLIRENRYAINLDHIKRKDDDNGGNG